MQRRRWATCGIHPVSQHLLASCMPACWCLVTPGSPDQHPPQTLSQWKWTSHFEYMAACQKEGSSVCRQFHMIPDDSWWVQMTTDASTSFQITPDHSRSYNKLERFWGLEVIQPVVMLFEVRVMLFECIALLWSSIVVWQLLLAVISCWQWWSNTSLQSHRPARPSPCLSRLGGFSGTPISEKCVVLLSWITHFDGIQRTICIHINRKRSSN